MNVVRKRKEDLQSEKKKNNIAPRRRKVSVNEPLEIIIEEKKASNCKDWNNNKDNVKIHVPEFSTIQPIQVKKLIRNSKLIKEVNHFAIPVDDSYDADSEDELFTQDIQVNVDDFEKIVDALNSYEPKDEVSALKVTSESLVTTEKQSAIFNYWRKNIYSKGKGASRRLDNVFHQRGEKQAKMGTRGERKREERTRAELYIHALHSRTILKDLLLAYEYYVKYAHRSFALCETHLTKFLDNFERELFEKFVAMMKIVLCLSSYVSDIVRENDPEDLETFIEATQTFPNYCPTPVRESDFSLLQ